MQITNIDFNLAMTRSQEVLSQKLNENNKSMIDHAAFQNTVDKKNEERAASVNFDPEIDTGMGQQDASDKGSNEYEGDGGARRGQRQRPKEAKKPEIPVEGRVIKKSSSHYDFKV